MTNQVYDASMMSDSSGDEGAIAIAKMNANLKHVDQNAVRFAIERSKELGNKFFKQKKYAGRFFSAFRKLCQIVIFNLASHRQSASHLSLHHKMSLHHPLQSFQMPFNSIAKL
jgi:hypothetical protein